MKPQSRSLIFLGFIGLTLLGLIFYTWRVSAEAQVVVEWSTASEFDTVGFNLYRSENPNDPGVLVNPELIPSSTDAQTGGDYAYNDEDVQSGRVYYYYLEDINAEGATNRNGPVIVKAQASGIILWGLIVALAVVIIFSIGWLLWFRRKEK
jgi:hypothetical protein